MRYIRVTKRTVTSLEADITVTINSGPDTTIMTYAQYETLCGTLSVTPMPSLESETTVLSYTISDEYFNPSFITTVVDDAIVYQPISFASLSIANTTATVDKFNDFALSSGYWSGIFYPVAPPP